MSLSSVKNRFIKSSFSKDVIVSVLFRGFNLVLNLVLLPLSLHLLGSKDYGIWLTISALNYWVSLFDLGTQNTLRNKLAESFNEGEASELRGLLMTNSFGFSFLLGILIVIFSVILYFTVDFDKILNISSGGNNVNLLVLLSLFNFALKLLSNNFNAILIALHKAYLTVVIATVTMFVTIVVFAFNFFYLKIQFSLWSYGLVSILIDLSITFFAPIIYLKITGFKYFFSRKYISISFFKNSLLANNLRFFILSTLIVLTFFSDNFFIGTMLSYKDVSAYNLVNKYFNSITWISLVALNPIWTQVSILSAKGDYLGIGLLKNKMNSYFFGFIALSIVLVLFSKVFYHFFGNGKIDIPNIVSIVAAIATLQLLFNNIHSFILNGMNKIGVQIKCMLFGSIIMVPLYYFLLKVLHTGILGAYIVQIVVFLPMTLVLPFYLRKIIKN